MPLDFPSNPVQGQIYNNFYYDATTGAWRSINSSVAPNSFKNMTISTTSAAGVPLTVQGYASQSANLQEWENSAGVVLSNISSAGALTLATPLTVANGGTGATSVVNAQTNLQIPTSNNYLINSAFDWWQRGTSFTTTAAQAYTTDRWITTAGTGATVVTSRQSFTPGAAPVAGYEGTYFCRFNRSTAGTTDSHFSQRIEDVRQCAGQTVTVSFWAKAAANYTIAAGDIYFYQYFGTGGSAAVGTSINTSTAITTSWQRFSYTVNVPSISGKTIGTNSYLEFTIKFAVGTGIFTADLWGLQIENGSVATRFSTASRTLQGELALCQRYYITGEMGGTYYIGTSNATGQGAHDHSFVPMRVAPTATVTSFTNQDNAANNGVMVLGNGRVNGNFRNSNTTYPYYNFNATFKLEAEL